MGAKKFEVSKKRATFLASKTGTVEADFLTWLTIHGNICLALRHPQNIGPSRLYAIQFVKMLGKALVQWGALTEEEFKDLEKLEIEEGFRDIGG